MMNNTPRGAKKHRESTKPESHQTAKMFSFFFFFRRASSKFAWLFHNGFRTKQQHFSPSSAPAHRFLPGSKSHEAIRLKNYGFLYDAIFSSRVRMRTNHLATKCNSSIFHWAESSWAFPESYTADHSWIVRSSDGGHGETKGLVTPPSRWVSAQLLYAWVTAW